MGIVALGLIGFLGMIPVSMIDRQSGYRKNKIATEQQIEKQIIEVKQNLVALQRNI